MDKDIATARLGGTQESAARWLQINASDYKAWPERLHPIMVDRVLAAVMRMETAKAMSLTPKQYFADPLAELFLHSVITRVSIAAVIANMATVVMPMFARTTDAIQPGQSLRRRPARRKRDDEPEASGAPA